MAFDPALVGIIGTVSGGILGGVVSYINGGAQFRREKMWEHRNFVRGKLEELHDAIEDFRRVFVRNMLSIQSNLQQGDLTVEAANEVKDISVSLSKIRLLAGFYAPEMQKSTNSLEEATQAFVLISSRMTDTTDHREIASDLNRLGQMVHGYCHTLQDELTKIARNYVEPR